MKTAMQEVVSILENSKRHAIESRDSLKNSYWRSKSNVAIGIIENNIDLINDLLFLEQKQIQIAFEMGAMPIVEEGDPTTGEQYYAKTFTTK